MPCMILVVTVMYSVAMLRVILLGTLVLLLTSIDGAASLLCIMGGGSIVVYAIAVPSTVGAGPGSGTP